LTFTYKVSFISVFMGLSFLFFLKMIPPVQVGVMVG
jgi:hypothetical protein